MEQRLQRLLSVRDACRVAQVNSNMLLDQIAEGLQRQFTELKDVNEKLKDEIKQLKEENAKLQEEIAALISNHTARWNYDTPTHWPYFSNQKEPYNNFETS